ncbi:glutathione S-transferase [Rhodobacteraceae bacterium D3-12]|nr:glutathione S-transferase [Rhodobacteraceae bacterium D3-12]
MIFYDCSTAPSPRRARMFIAEKGLDIETREISLAKAEQLSDAFLAINPRATVPVLVTDDGTTLTENIAIAAYLDARFPEPPLLGSTPDERGEIAMWNAIAEGQCGMPVAETLRNSHPAMKGRALPGPLDLEQIPELAARGQQRLGAFFDLLEERLQNSAWVGGAQFSVADITAYVFVDFARVVKTRIPEANTATRAWYDGMAARPSAKL